MNDLFSCFNEVFIKYLTADVFDTLKETPQHNHDAI